MDLLVLGGSDFAGRSLVADALARGWNITTLHRGRREPAAGVTALVGDRPTPGGTGCPGRPGTRHRRRHLVVGSVHCQKLGRQAR
jgi:nucleoside-diphosphate-sugar epimerase